MFFVDQKPPVLAQNLVEALANRRPGGIPRIPWQAALVTADSYKNHT